MQWLCHHYYNLFASVIVGSLLGVGFVIPVLWWLCVIGLVWWFVYITQSATYTQASLRGIGTFLVLNIWAYSWFSSVPPIDWVPVADQLVWVLILMYWFTSALWVSLPGFLLAPLVLFTHRHTTKTLVVAASSVGWVLADVLGSVLFSVFFFGSGGTINANMSVGYLGYLIAQHPTLFHLSAWGGVYLLTLFWIVLGGILWILWQWWCKTQKFVVVVGGILFLSLIFYPYPRIVTHHTTSDTYSSTNKYTVLVLETRFVGQLHEDFIPPSNRRHYYQEVLEAVELDTYDYIIFPEDARFLAGYGQNMLGLIQLRQLFGTTTEAVVIDSGRTEVGEEIVLRGTILQTSDFSTMQFDKQYLVPQGEFMPQVYATVLRLFGLGAVITDIEQSLAYRPGPYREQSRLDTKIPRILFCFESINPRGVRDVIDRNSSVPPLIVHPLSHAWFTEPTILHQQLDSMLRIQARWNGVHIVSAGNKAPSNHYLPDGSFLSSADLEPLASNQFVTAYEFTF